MQHKFTYWSDLGSSKLSEGDSQQWVHALPVGEFQHPTYGKLSFSADRIARFAESVKNRVLGIDPDIDYDHKLDASKGNKAAGWVKDAEARSNGLWLLVEWTKEAAKAIREREYRYFSAEFVDELVDPQGNKLKDVVRGGGLTNRPFMKNLVPINLNELVGENDNNQEEVMDRAELAKLLGLSEDATEEQIKAKLAEVNDDKGGEKVDLSKAEVTVGEDGTVKVTHPDLEGEVTHKLELPEPKGKEGSDEELEKLAKDNPAVAAVLSEHKQLRDSVQALEASQRLSEVSVQLSDIGKDSNAALPPAVVDKLKGVMVRLPKQLSDEIADAMTHLVKLGGPVKLTEVSGGGRDGSKPTGDPVKKFTDEVDKLRKDNKELTYRAAVDEVRLSEPELWQDYQAAISEGVTLSD